MCDVPNEIQIERARTIVALLNDCGVNITLGDLIAAIGKCTDNVELQELSHTIE